MPIIRKTLAEIAATPLSAAEQARLAALARLPDSAIDFSDQEEITAEKIAAGHYVVVRRGGARPGAGRKPTGNRPMRFNLPPEVIRRVKAEARKRGLTLSAYAALKLAR